MSTGQISVADNRDMGREDMIYQLLFEMIPSIKEKYCLSQSTLTAMKHDPGDKLRRL
jgi:hypothetical protein